MSRTISVLVNEEEMEFSNEMDAIREYSRACKEKFGVKQTIIVNEFQGDVTLAMEKDGTKVELWSPWEPDELLETDQFTGEIVARVL